jgi:homoserine dehydrogenase
VVELVGGSDGPALALARNTLGGGKSFVTANKAMIAHHGLELARAAEAANLALKFEAAVAGGVPVIKGLREGAAANVIARVYGILNGTCNFILSKMEAEGRDFADMLSEAQALGYAEADPSFDIDGVDAAHKLSILASLAFGTQPAFGDVAITGIRHVLAADIAEAAALGYRVRLLGVADSGPARAVPARPSAPRAAQPPARACHRLDQRRGRRGQFRRPPAVPGRRRGRRPDRLAVVADLIDIARGEFGPPYAMPADALAAQHPRRQRRTPRPRLCALHRRRQGRRARRDRRGDARCRRLDREPDPARRQSRRQRARRDRHARRARARVAQALEKLRGSQSLVGEPMWMHILGD